MLHRTVAGVIIESDAVALAATTRIGIGQPRRGIDVRERGLDAVIMNIIGGIGAEAVIGAGLLLARK